MTDIKKIIELHNLAIDKIWRFVTTPPPVHKTLDWLPRNEKVGNRLVHWLDDNLLVLKKIFNFCGYKILPAMFLFTAVMYLISLFIY